MILCEGGCGVGSGELVSWRIVEMDQCGDDVFLLGDKCGGGLVDLKKEVVCGGVFVLGCDDGQVGGEVIGDVCGD